MPFNLILPLKKNMKILKSFLNFQKKRGERFFWKMPRRVLRSLNQRLRA